MTKFIDISGSTIEKSRKKDQKEAVVTLPCLTNNENNVKLKPVLSKLRAQRLPAILELAHVKDTLIPLHCLTEA